MRWAMHQLTRKSLQIVQVDDSDDFTRITEIFLQHEGFLQPIACFDCGKKALDYLSKVDPTKAPQVVLLDLNMPGMNGLEVLRWLRKAYQDLEVPIYMLTASESPENRRRAMEAGITKYLHKSDLYSELIHDLDQVIALYNLRRQAEVMKKSAVMVE